VVFLTFTIGDRNWQGYKWDTLRNMNLIGKEIYTKLSTNLKESDTMDDFPPSTNRTLWMFK